MSLFESKIGALALLDENGFDVKLLQQRLGEGIAIGSAKISLIKLLEAKWDHTKHLGDMGELK